MRLIGSRFKSETLREFMNVTLVNVRCAKRFVREEEARSSSLTPVYRKPEKQSADRSIRTSSRNSSKTGISPTSTELAGNPTFKALDLRWSNAADSLDLFAG
jgi:hypothetical protein